MNRKSSACNINIDKNNYSKYRTVCKSCYNKNARKNNKNTKIENELRTSFQQPKIDNVNKKNTTLLFQLMKITVLFLSVQATVVKLVTR